MKQCPSCRRVYFDETLSFCLEDGTPLVTQAPPEITQRYTPPATERFETTRDTAQPPQNEFQIVAPFVQKPARRSKIWLIPAAVALVLLIAGGSIGAFLLLRNKSAGAPNANVYKAVSNTVLNRAKTNTAVSNAAASNNSVANVPVSNAADTPAPSSSPEEEEISSDTLAGTWESDVVEQGAKTHITYTLNADGTSKMFFKSPNGQTGNDRGTWRFSDNILNERFADGTSAKGSIRMIDEDTFEITIIDNGVPAYKGVKRIYRRKK